MKEYTVTANAVELVCYRYQVIAENAQEARELVESGTVDGNRMDDETQSFEILTVENEDEIALARAQRLNAMAESHGLPKLSPHQI